VAEETAAGGLSSQAEEWGPREVVAYLAGWEAIASVHVPPVTAGMPPLFAYADPAQQRVLNEALNAAMVTLVAVRQLTHYVYHLIHPLTTWLHPLHPAR